MAARNHRNHYFGAEDKARIEIIPMIDVMMFLLVFFVLIMTEMIQGSGLPVQLPSAEQSETLSQGQGSRTLTLALTADGRWQLQGQAVTPEGLPAELKAAAAGGPAPSLVIAGDRAVPYERIVKAMDLARSAGVKQIGLATQAP